jgi:2,3,4,5-tetrahydropyridine-2-carboxylate N-succinyltransferase
MNIEAIINAGWEERTSVTSATHGELRTAVNAALSALDAGELRVAEPDGTTHQWLKKAVLLSFRLHDNVVMPGFGHAGFYDKVPLKFDAWGDAEFRAAGFRAVPGAVVRRGAYIAPGAVLMPSFVNIGENVHISGGAGIGGVLEPLQANPVIIGDNAFIGARAEVAEGVIVGEGAVLSMGVYLGASTKIIDRATGEIHMGRVPPYAVVVSGSLPGKPLPDGTPGPNLYCAVIVKTVDAQTRSKTGINELLRD